jgi:hypothetical protein
MNTDAPFPEAEPGLIDDFAGLAGVSRLGTPWRLVTDQVMGGVSQGHMARTLVGGRPALCLRGDVSLENNGGFVQVNLDLAPAGSFDASGFRGVRLVVRGNGDTYSLHLKSADCLRPWQSYRAEFMAGPDWQEVELPFARFTPHRLTEPLDLSRLMRLGIVAIGRTMHAEVCMARIGFV